MLARSHSMYWVQMAGLAGMLALFSPTTARAQDTLGAHFGFVLPLVTRVGGETTTLSDQFSIGFPTGITVKKTAKVAFDLELVPTIQRTPFTVGLTVHPGIICSLPHGYSAGLRMAFDVNKASWGFTPLLHHSLVAMGTSTLFGEAVVPVRFHEDDTSIGLGVHVGIGF